MYQNILFDLDGTLTDPGLGITNAVMYALNRYNIEVKDRQELCFFIGPPLHEAFMKFCDFDETKAKEAVSVFREYYRDKGLFENEVYDGIKEMLAELKASGKKLVVATSKPEEFAIKVLKHFDLYEYFDFVAGATFDTTRVKKADVIAYALKETGITDLDNTIMIGDRLHDIVGAKAFGLDSIGVLYGYGSQEEFVEAGATYIVNEAKDIVKIVK